MAEYASVNDIKDGVQFAAVWTASGKIWAETFKKNGSEVFVSSEDGDCFTPYGEPFPTPHQKIIRLFTVEEETVEVPVSDYNKMLAALEELKSIELI